MTEDGQKTWRRTTLPEIIGAWEVVGKSFFSRHFVVTEDHRVGWLLKDEDTRNVSYALLYKRIDAQPADEWERDNWQKFAFLDGEMTVYDKSGNDIGGYSFLTAISSVTLRTWDGIIEVMPDGILWSETYRPPAESEGAVLFSPQPLRQFQLRRLPDL